MTFGVLNPNPHPGRVEKLPSFGSQFSSALGQGLGEGVNKGISDAMKNSALERALGMVNPELSPLQQYMALSQEDPEAREQVMGFLGGHAKNQHEFDKIRLTQELKNSSKSQASQLQPEQKARLQNTYNTMAQLLKKGTLGKRVPFMGGGPFSRQSTQDRARFNTLNVGLESVFKDMVNKGTMSNARFQFMIENLPKDDDSDRTILGKMQAISDELGLDPSELPDFDNDKTDSISKGTVIRNPKTGATKIWNGTRWQDQKG